MYRIEPMTQEDVAEVSRVERRCFSNPWPSSAYRRELRHPEQNFYIVLRALPDEVAMSVSGSRSGNGHAPARGGDGLRHFPRLPILSFGRRLVPNSATPHLAGFAGMWIMYDEAHITTIGTDPIYRGQGFGELMLVVLIEEAVRRAATWLTLEVRVSNDVAQRLYRKYGFSVQGTRRRYYSDNGEDAFIMWSRSLKDPAYLAELSELRQAILDRLDPVLAPPLAESAS